MVRVEDNISGTSFINSVIGSPGQIINLSGTTMRNCNFKGTRFISKALFRNVDAEGCNFSEADLSLVEYQYANLVNCKFCETVMRIGSRLGLGAKFDKNLFRELTKWWGIDVRIGKEIINAHK